MAQRRGGGAGVPAAGPDRGPVPAGLGSIAGGQVQALFGNAGPLALILGTAALALLLRWSVSLPLALFGSAFVGGLTGLAMLGLGVNYLDQLAGFYAEIFADIEAQLAAESGEEVKLTPPGIVTIAGLLGLLNTIGCLLCLLLARWWQAMLYNPGGFRAEFHALRFPPQVSSLLVALLLLVSMANHEFRPWAALFAIPLCVAGLGLVHARAAFRGQGSGYLTLFYLLWIFLDPVKLIVLGLAILDSWFDFRSRWRRPGETDSDNEQR